MPLPARQKMFDALHQISKIAESAKFIPFATSDQELAEALTRIKSAAHAALLKARK